MHLSNRQRTMNKTFTILSNKHCSLDSKLEQDQWNVNQLSMASNDDRFRTFTKCKIKPQSEAEEVNHHQQRYFDSPTMITLDDEDENDEIPISRCSNRTSAGTAAATEPSLNEAELSDLLIFTNPNRVLTESMQVVISRHPSLNDFKYINDLSSVLVLPSLSKEDQEEEPIYQEIIRSDHSIMTPPPMEYMDTTGENKENRPPLMPIKCQVSRIPVWTPSPMDKHLNVSGTTINSNNKHEVKKKVTTAAKPCLTGLLDEWSCMAPKLKELLSNTRKMPLRMPHLTTNSSDFRRLKQLLQDMEVTTCSWTNAINQCRYVLQHAQQQLRRS